MSAPVRLLTFTPRLAAPVVPREDHTLSVNSQRVQAILARLEGIAAKRPGIANFLLELNERFLTRWERYIAEGTR